MTKVITIVTITLLSLSIFLGILTYLYKTTTSPLNTTKKITQQLQPTQSPISECALTLSPENKTVLAGRQNSIDITIGSDGNYPTEIQLEMSYDPTALTNVQVTPGDFLPNAKILLNNIDTATGRISFAVILPPKQKPINRSGVIATISFIPNTMKTESQILFLPKTTVYSFKQPAILKQAEGANIIVAIPTNIASKSAELTPPAALPGHSR
jgi:hypothetical protein